MGDIQFQSCLREEPKERLVLRTAFSSLLQVIACRRPPGFWLGTLSASARVKACCQACLPLVSAETLSAEPEVWPKTRAVATVHAAPADPLRDQAPARPPPARPLDLRQGPRLQPGLTTCSVADLYRERICLGNVCIQAVFWMRLYTLSSLWFKSHSCGVPAAPYQMHRYHPRLQLSHSRQNHQQLRTKSCHKLQH